MILCDFFKEETDNTASYRVRWLSAQEMAKQGKRAIFVYPTTTHKLVVEKDIHSLSMGVPGIPFKSLRRGGFSISDCLFKLSIILYQKPDVVWTVNGHRPSNFIPAMFARLFCGSLIIDETWEWLGQGGYGSSRQGFFGKIIGAYDILFEICLKEKFDRILVISEELKKRFKAKNKVSVLWGGSEDSNLTPYPIETARSYTGIPSDVFVIGMSSVVPGDHEANRVFFSAFSAIFKDYPDLFLLMTGSDRHYIERVAREYGFKDRLIYPGYLSFDDYNKYLSSCNLFVLPYPDTLINRGRWPNKFSDYVCLERPVLTNPTGDIKNFIRQYRTGFLCQHSVKSYCEYLNGFMKNNIDNSIATFNAAKKQLSFSKRIENILKTIKI